MQKRKFAKLMKKDFISLSKDVCDFSLQKDDLKFSFATQSLNKDFIKLNGKIFGQTPYRCDRCGEEFSLEIDEDVEVLVSDKIVKPLENELQNIIEFLDGQVDFDEIFTSEIEAIKSDYFYCKDCKTKN